MASPARLQSSTLPSGETAMTASGFSSQNRFEKSAPMGLHLPLVGYKTSLPSVIPPRFRSREPQKASQNRSARVGNANSGSRSKTTVHAQNHMVRVVTSRHLSSMALGEDGRALLWPECPPFRES